MTARPKGRSLLGAAGLDFRRAAEEEVVTEQPVATEATDLRAVISDVPPAAEEPPTVEIAREARTTFRRMHRNVTPQILSGAVIMKTVYLTRSDRDRADDAVAALKKTHQLRGQVGFSLATRIALKLLEDRLAQDPMSVLAIARRLSAQSNREV